jgi:hypothetical protein
MPAEWKVRAATEDELEKALQGFDGHGFDVFEIFSVQESMKTRFVVVGRRELTEGRKRRHYEAQAVAIRCSNGLLLHWLDPNQPLQSTSHQVGVQETFLMIRLEGRYGDEIVAFRAGADQWLTMSNEAFTGPLTLNGPDVGAWQMFSALPRERGKVVLRTFRLQDGSHNFLGLDEESRLEARPDLSEDAETFVLEPIRSHKPEELGVTLCW